MFDTTLTLRRNMTENQQKNKVTGLKHNFDKVNDQKKNMITQRTKLTIFSNVGIIVTTLNKLQYTPYIHSVQIYLC